MVATGETAPTAHWFTHPGETLDERLGVGHAPSVEYHPAVADVLLATDADWIYDEVDAALSGAHTVSRVRRGADVLDTVASLEPALVILDLQIGNMGGMAASLNLRLEQRAGRIEPVRILMLLDREHDVWLAQQAEADGWLVKPIDSFRLRRAADTALDGKPYTEGLTQPA